jgi:hypothetical protein
MATKSRKLVHAAEEGAPSEKTSRARRHAKL